MQKKVFLSGIEKVAILLNVLGKEKSYELMKDMKDNDIRRLLQVMGSMKKAPLAVVNSVLQEYLYKINETEEIIFEENFTTPDVIAKGLGEERAKQIIGTSRIMSFVNRKNLSVLEAVDTKVMVEFLVDEHPQTIALVLAHMDIGKQITMIKNLPDSLRAEVLLRMSNLDFVAPEKIDELDELLHKELISQGKIHQQPVGGVQVVADLINSLDKKTMESVIQRLQEKDPILAEEIRQHMFVFTDIARIDQRGMQLILREVPNEVLLLALKSAPEEVLEKIYSAMSTRAADMLKEDLAALGPQKVSDVEKAQRQIVSIVRRLSDEGKIVIGISDEQEIIP